MTLSTQPCKAHLLHPLHQSIDHINQASNAVSRGNLGHVETWARANQEFPTSSSDISIHQHIASSITVADGKQTAEDPCHATPGVLGSLVRAVVCIDGVVSAETGGTVTLALGDSLIRVNRRCLLAHDVRLPGVLVVCPVVAYVSQSDPPVEGQRWNRNVIETAEQRIRRKYAAKAGTKS